ncbi:MAG: GDP-mannose 4,6-dehydratase, partial [Candidatus Bathyarchaeia archaeon]
MVTGGAGFIGSHLVGKLLMEDFKVIVLDNFFTGSLENIQMYVDNPSFQVVKGDIRGRKVVRETVKEADYIFHLAAIASIPLSFKKPKKINEVNVIGTLNLLEE